MGGLSLEEQILIKSGRRCCICYGLHGDLQCKRGQIAHLDHNHQNNVLDNLAFICLQHHDEYDSRTSQSKGWKINEVKHYRAKLYEAIESLHLEAERQITDISRELYDAYDNLKLPVCGSVFYTSGWVYTLKAVSNDTGQRYDGVSAHPLLYNLTPTFEITNPNRFDLRIVRLYVDVIKYIGIDILEVEQSTRESGASMQIREFGCEIEPKIGTYECSKDAQSTDYLRLSFGEMEVLRINVDMLSEGIYRLRIGFDYSISGNSKKFELENSIQEIAVFDPVFHKPIFRDIQNRVS